MTEQPPENRLRQGYAGQEKRSRRIYIYWGVALALLLAAGLVCWQVIIPIWQTHNAIASLRPNQEGAIAHSIMRLGGEEKAAERLAGYARMPDWIVSDRNRFMAIHLLGHCGRSAYRPLLRRLKDSSLPLRVSSADAMARVLEGQHADGSDAVAPLCDLLRTNDPGSQMASMRALAAIGEDARAATGQLAALVTDERDALSFLAARALGKIGPGAKSAVPELKRVVGSGYPIVRAEAIWALTRIEGTKLQDMTELRRGLCGLPPGASSGTSGDLPEKEIVVRLVGRLRCDWPELRECACWVLGSMGAGASSAVPALTRQLNHPDASVRRAAAEALKKIRAAEKKEEAVK